MNDETRELDRLISRYLDEESSIRERREFERRLDHDPAAAELFEDYAVIDRDIGVALREALLRPRAPTRRKSRREKYARVGMLAAAACLAALFWFAPPQVPDDVNRPATARVQPGSWFAAPTFSGDELVERPTLFNRSVNWVGKPKTEWIVIPAERAGEYMVIEVDRVLTQTRRERRDF